MATEPLVLNFRTISAQEQSDSPDTTIFTMELKVTNMDTSTYHDVAVTAISLTDPAMNYGSVAVGDLSAGGSQTVIGTFHVPTDSIDDMKLRLDHS